MPTDRREIRSGQSSVVESNSGGDGKGYMQPIGKYLESPEAVAEYKKTGLVYPRNYKDNAYQEFLERTPGESEGNEFASQNYTRVLAIYRVRQQGGKEFITWSQREVRFTPLGNPESFAKTNMGVYPVLRYQTVREEDKRGIRRTITRPTGEVYDAYSLSFTVDNLDNLYKDCNDTPDLAMQPGDTMDPVSTHYYVKDLRNGTTITVESYQDLRDGKFEDLYSYGKKIESDREAKDLKRAQEKQRKKIEEAKRQRLG